MAIALLLVVDVFVQLLRYLYVALIKVLFALVIKRTCRSPHRFLQAQDRIITLTKPSYVHVKVPEPKLYPSCSSPLLLPSMNYFKPDLHQFMFLALLEKVILFWPLFMSEFRTY